jgi:predicted house-cleaning noncanonical NTP pyrophosphatase (MazG superfamily)
VTELADLYEVIDAIMVTHGIQQETVLEEQERKRLKRGGFEARLRLLWASDS